MDLMDEDSRRAYPAMYFLVRHGNGIAAILAALIPLAGLWAWLAGYSVLLLVGGVLCGPIAYLFLRSYVEMARLIADMLLPK